MRRFRLAPVNVGAGGFQQTVILPPPQGVQVVEVPAGPDPCAGVAAPPSVLNVNATPFACGPNETPYYFFTPAGALPAGYVLVGPEGGGHGDVDAACLDPAPTYWRIRRECDNAILQIPLNITYESA
jgi:hypothetical protein